MPEPLPPALLIGGGGLLFGAGTLAELGRGARERGLRRVLLIGVRAVADVGLLERAEQALGAAGVVHATLLAADGEPTDAAIGELVAAARGGDFEGIVALGGGSVIDTAKVVGLLLGAGGSTLDYVNAPFGRGAAPPRPPLPLIAVPTTAGSGSEVSAVAVLDLVADDVKTAISHPLLRPALAIADPATTVTLPPAPTAAAGLDVLAHALESLTALPYARRTLAPGAPRPAYSGANPYSDALCEQALPLLARGLPRAVRDGGSLDARTDVMLAATLAGLGAAVAGAHAGHACAYGVASRRLTTAGAAGRPVAHGFAAALMLAPLLRRTHASDPARHERAARLLDVDGPAAEAPDHPREPSSELLPARVAALIAAVGAPSGLRELGFDERDVVPMAELALRQERLMAGAPMPLGREQLAAMLAEAL
ncbi:iron-containing alcohol dehydrogenase [Conexibacter stalactiti]|uniref:Iron-containing alcohol dehydrogenase n=1 Tax=Conexibacter stalactiti TaxID=1940611 RepID=A0ABU4HV32_9ACTN|nr:iron-containing alcohol dehydrogenase [Conexibacter stalactiti]MDW5596405.1 iron-containing alcohol dehydrogenase [Conexibacter stalactiti]MEC5037047.1 iron-containing alcohol dehydrogenase [Conexibacter stalactiti]